MAVKTPKINVQLTRANGHTSRVQSGVAVTDAMVKRAEQLIAFLSTGVDPIKEP